MRDTEAGKIQDETKVRPPTGNVMQSNVAIKCGDRNMNFMCGMQQACVNACVQLYGCHTVCDIHPILKTALGLLVCSSAA
jgi:hypothetical protein